ncbi:esterase family protein [Oenococcus kitaharae]|uniref:alpha/beta hydrolase n=1 Tax=Oenococcus TaxID=46254 RepID=UPI0021E73ECB|nr:alpha/beta hydrolase family protein [Oenococcus kitaharae]MCV3296242.1 esterase family protein [Oenococcus kitaharae]
MSLHSNRFFSNSLGRTTSVQVVLPEIKNEQMRLPKYKKGETFPVLWLLHGLGDDDTVWLRRAGIERLANDYGVAMVMPQAERSFYADMSHGDKYWTYITQELPERMRFIFPLSSLREDNFLAGYSMGGYGALRWAFKYPRMFSAVAGMSSVIDLPKFVNNLKNGVLGYPDSPDIEAIWGKQDLVNSDLNISWLLNHPALGLKDLRVFITAGGKEDFLNEDNENYQKKLNQIFGSNFTWDSGQGGHNWDFWAPELEHVLSWLPIHERR